MGMRQIDVEELKRIQLEIIDVVMKFCDENNISCWLSGGTLIGAIRHKGYIPWDDDIDLGMLRPDYNKFMKLFNTHNTRYKFVCYENDDKFYMPFGKVFDTSTVLYEPDEKGIKMAVNIDIFVADNAPDDDKALRKMLMWQKIYRSLHMGRVFPAFAPPNGNMFRKICVYAFRILMHMIPQVILPKNYFAGKLVKLSKTYADTNTKRVGDFVGAHYLAVDRSLFSDTVYGEFEGRKYKLPVGYDSWLRGLYGDYMQLPPEDERISHHHFKAFVNDKISEAITCQS